VKRVSVTTKAVALTAITQPPGELIRYFCSINDHYREGMTGILRVITPIGG
jgi:hypothetical protein